MRRLRAIVVLGFLSLPLTLAPAARADTPAAPKKTPLDEYVAKPDPAYAWKLVKTIPGDGYTTYVVDLTSQNWRTVPDVDRTTWKHWLTIIKPDRVEGDTAFLYIGGGKNGNPAPDKPGQLPLLIAKGSHTVVAELGQIPNQPLVLSGDGHPRSEDDLIAACWIKSMDSGDATWLPRLPMVKSAVRAMDTVTALLGSEQGGKTAVKKFVVMGGSKRGWTTWMVGAVGPRVAAIIPAVIDVVNVRACSINHYSAYGFWAEAIGDYTRHNVKDRMDTPEYDRLLHVVDPYFYRDRFTMPKFIVNASGDQYFPPDSSKFYFGEMPGVKYLRYVPNANHSLGGTDAPESMLAFYRAIVRGKALPKFSWKVEQDDTIRVRTDDRPLEVNLWQATNPKARDFRLQTIGPAYKKTTLKTSGDGVYVAKVEKPPEGWTAFFVELVYDSGDTVPYKFTTQVHVVPDVLPHSIEEFRKTLKQK